MIEAIPMLLCFTSMKLSRSWRSMPMSVNMMPLALPQANCMLLLSCLPLALWTGVPVILDHHLFPLVFAYVRKR